MLTISGLEAGYGTAQTLFGVDFRTDPGEVLALMGRNGMGKTTTVRSIMGLLRPSAGQVIFCGRDLTGAPPHRIARAGIGLVPEGRMVFPTLTVEENLLAAAASRSGRSRWTSSSVFELFPGLLARRRHRGHQLSGGEQQMLAIGRALMTNPALLILDEATEGLAPQVAGEIYTCLAKLRAEGESILLIDKHLAKLTQFADRIVILEKGRVAWSGAAGALAADPTLADQFLHV